MQRNSICSWIIVALCVVGALGICLPVCAETVDVKFAPRDGLTFIEKTVTQRAQKVYSNGVTSMNSEQHMTMKRRITIHKTATGYLIDYLPLKMTDVRSGSAPHSADAAELKRDACSYVLDAKGKLLEVKGTEASLKYIESKLTDRQKKNFSADRYKQALLQARQQEWGRDVAQFIGAHVGINSSETVTKLIRVPNPFSRTGGTKFPRRARRSAPAIPTSADENVSACWRRNTLTIAPW